MHTLKNTAVQYMSNLIFREGHHVFELEDKWDWGGWFQESCCTDNSILWWGMIVHKAWNEVDFYSITLLIQGKLSLRAAEFVVELCRFISELECNAQQSHNNYQ